MRKVLIALGALIVVGGAVFYALTLPAVMEQSFAWTCGTATTERCIIRMRGMGHVYSGKDNPERAAHWYRRGAEAGDPAAMFHLAWTLEERGLVQFRAAISDMAARRAADAPNQSVSFSRSPFEEAILWYRRAADQGFAPAMNNLANLYEQSFLGSRNLDEGFRWYAMAARAGNPIGAFNLSAHYRDGLGVKRDIAEADKWSRWSPENFARTDLSEPTLERTRIFGHNVVAPLRAKLRAVAGDGPPAYATLERTPLKPDPNLPTFSQVRDQPKGQQR
jgi:hypothetical protein